MNQYELKAQRQSLGFTVLQISEHVKLTKRSWQYLETGKIKIPVRVKDVMQYQKIRYNKFLELITSDIAKHNITSLPFFVSLESYMVATGDKSPLNHKIWQSVLGHLLLTGELKSVCDTDAISTDYELLSWFD